MRKLFQAALAALLLTAAGPAGAAEFAISFDWGDIPLCGGGVPDIVDNPRFELENVPTGTRYIHFHMVDLDNLSMDHGGGMVEYWGEEQVPPGKFKYRGPCPEQGFHMYRWTAKALTTDNPMAKPLATASSDLEYP